MGGAVRCRARVRRATSLTEMIFFGAIASVLMVLIISLLARGSKFIELGRRVSGSQTDLRTVLELLAEDAGEIVQFEGAGGEMNASGGFSFLVHSSRAEKGIPAGQPSTRKIEYKLDGPDPLKDVLRSVTVQGAGPAGGGGGGSERFARAGIAQLRAFPIAVVPKGTGYVLKPASDGQARQPGASPACLVVEISAGVEAGAAQTKVEKDTLATIVTKLWCRNRVMELARGALR